METNGNEWKQLIRCILSQSQSTQSKTGFVIRALLTLTCTTPLQDVASGRRSCRRETNAHSVASKGTDSFQRHLGGTDRSTLERAVARATISGGRSGWRGTTTVGGDKKAVDRGDPGKSTMSAKAGKVCVDEA